MIGWLCCLQPRTADFLGVLYLLSVVWKMARGYGIRRGLLVNLRLLEFNPFQRLEHLKETT